MINILKEVNQDIHKGIKNAIKKKRKIIYGIGESKFKYKISSINEIENLLDSAKKYFTDNGEAQNPELIAILKEELQIK